jgi:acetylornithine deacetylase
VRSLIERLKGRDVLPRFGIVGEPTNLRIAVGHKGKIGARATSCGVEGHSALAPKALNAIHLACDFIGELRQRRDMLEHNGERDPAYDVPYTTIHAGKIPGGTVLNILPNSCTVDFEIRNVANDDAGALLNSLMDSAAEVASRHHKRFPRADIRIEVFNAYPGLATKVDDEVVAFAKSLVDDPSLMKVAFGTEGGMFSDQLGIPMVVCGPGSMDQGHKADEFISLDQLDGCDSMLDRLLNRLIE